MGRHSKKGQHRFDTPEQAKKKPPDRGQTAFWGGYFRVRGLEIAAGQTDVVQLSVAQA